MVHIYEVWTYTKAKLTVIASDSSERDAILEKCHIEVAIVRHIAKCDNIIISKNIV